MEHEKHCEESLKTFGKEFKKVHRWLDYFYSNEGIDEKGIFCSFIGQAMHRKVRHHQEGIEKCRKIFGEESVGVAEQHIKSDTFGYVPKKSDYKNQRFWIELGRVMGLREMGIEDKFNESFLQ